MRQPNEIHGRRATHKAYALVDQDDSIYTPEELEFLRAIQKYKEDNRRPHPTWCEVFQVFKELGYRKGE